ncbi:RHS repeat-associated core domain-containing protein [Burkholderia pyrrocinia]|uniref:RHS repeat-associated core domain-containing protein n=1 Tax=Burkholderia pyrrocinia TaxID=60550 RepID=UPI00158B0A9E|nr:RHS repeat-associated core domain-containing protein [Burkholderia pyrrocinia]
MSEFETRLSRASAPAESHATQSDSKPDTACDSLLGTVKSAFDPFKETFSSEGGTFHHVSEAVNSLASLQGMPSQLLNTGIAQIPLLDKMPGMPAATIGVPHLGTPHAHSHPPSSGFPLPSVGATIGSGCLSVLIGGIPAARVLDIGIAPTCGGITPFFDIQTGSSNTFIGGMRAARMGIDMTRHCNPMRHVGHSGGEAASAAEKGEEVASEAAQVSGRAKMLGRAGKAWKVGNAAVGPASGVATAADDASQGEIEAAAMTAAQTAADLAFMMLGNLMGKDPGIEPSMGTLLAGDPTVLIGGFPLPDSQMMWHGAKHGIAKKVKTRVATRQKAAAPCRNGHPVDVVRGTAENEFVDYQEPAHPGFSWERFYCSGWRDQDGAIGYGFRHNFQHELHLLRTRAVYVDSLNREYQFPRNQDGRYSGEFGGYRLTQRDDRRFTIWHETAGIFDFERHRATGSQVRLVGHAKGRIRSEYRHDATGVLSSISLADEDGQAWRLLRFVYDNRGHIIQILMTGTDGVRRCIARYAYDSNGCLSVSTDPLDAAMSYEYDYRRRMVRETDRNGFSFVYRYDVEGRCIETAAQDGLWRVTFDYQPRRTIATHADGGIWTFQYDDSQTVTRILDPYGHAVDRVTGADGRILLEVDAVGRELRWVYDNLGRSMGRVDRWGNCWPPDSQVPVRQSPKEHVLPVTSIDQQWGAVEPQCLPSTLLLPIAIEQYAKLLFSVTESSPLEEHDAAGRVMVRRAATGGIDHLTRDAVGNVVRKRDHCGSEYRYAITSWNLYESTTDPLGHVTRYRYTNKAQISVVIDPVGNESRYDYDLRGRLVRVTRHDTIRETYKYDGGDRLVEKCDATGEWLLRFEFGGNGLPSKRLLRSGETHYYQHDTLGNFTNASTDRFEVTLKWDAFGRIVSDKRDGFGIEHQYAEMKRVSTTWFERFSVSYESDGAGETVVRTQTGGTHRISRSSDGHVLVQLGNRTSVLRRFEADGKCEGRIVWRGEARTGMEATHYAYSATGELLTVTSTSGDMIEYQYDDAHRLIGEKRAGWPIRRFAYDQAGNLISTPEHVSIRYNEGNRLATASATRFHYDNRNHLATQVDEGGNHTTYSYNSMDLLTLVEWSNRADTWTADYDGLCRRIYQTCGEACTFYYWDNDRLAAEIQPHGQIRLYLYGDESAILPFMFIEYESIDAKPEEGTEYFVIANQVGMPEWIENNAGKIVWRAQSIDPYGQIEVEPGNSIAYDLRFAGHHYDQATGLHYNRFRTYSPALRRYLQSDPIGQSGGVNVYAYTTNPLVQVDVLGLSCDQPAGKASEGAEGHHTEDEPVIVAKDQDGKYRPTGALFPKNLIHVPEKERPAYEKARQSADKMYEDIKNAVGDFHRITFLPFVFKKKDGSYHVGVAASKEWSEIEKGNSSIHESLSGIIDGHELVTGAGEIPAHESYPAVSQYDTVPSTDHHAEQRALRWADSKPDIEGCAYFAPTEAVCEGCRQAIYWRVPHHPDGKMTFDPDDPDTGAIARRSQGADYYSEAGQEEKDLPRSRIEGVKKGAINDVLVRQAEVEAKAKARSIARVKEKARAAAQAKGESESEAEAKAEIEAEEKAKAKISRPPKPAMIKDVAKLWKVDPKVLKGWVDKEGSVRAALEHRPEDKKMPSDETLKKVAKLWKVEEKSLPGFIKKFLTKGHV